MKKLICLLLSACLLTAALAGCGGKKDKEGESSGLSSSSAVSAVATPTPAPQTAKALRVTADAGLNIRAEASTEGEILGLAENGERLALMVEDAQNGWYQIQYQGETAYVSADYAEVIEVTLEEYNQLRSGSAPAQEEPSSSTAESSSSVSSSQAESSSQSESSAPSSSSQGDSEDGE